jgi:biopolymer transport protein ExbD
LRIKRPAEQKARIELIPMIDTMAFLLVFFMIASLAMTQQAGLPVNLPRADASVAPTWGDRALVVTLDDDGKVYLDKDEISADSLTDEVASRLAGRPELVIVLNADKSLRHGAVVRAMDAVKAAGAVRMAIATDPSE